MATTEHEEAIIHADIGKHFGVAVPHWTNGHGTDPEMMEKTRRGIPVTVQRRFDVYPDVAA